MRSSVPAETNRLADRMLDGNFERAMYQALAILGSKISLESVQDKPAAQITPADDKSKAAWESLPEEVRRAIEEIVRGAAGAAPYVHKAFDWNAVARVGRRREDGQSRNGRACTATRPVRGWDTTRMAANSFAALVSFQATPLGNGAAVVFSSVRAAINDLVAGCQDGKIPALRFAAAQDQCRARCACWVRATTRIEGASRSSLIWAGTTSTRGGWRCPRRKRCRSVS